MKKFYYLFAAFVISNFIFAQENNGVFNSKNEFAIGISAFQTKLVDRNFLGIAFDGRIYAAPKWAIGLNFAVTSKNISNDFNYYVEKPTVTFLEFNFVNQFDFYKTNRFRLGFTLSNGYGVAVLSDRAYTDNSNEYSDIPLKISSNNFYVLQAGIETAIRLQKDSDGYDIYLKSDIKNRKTFGNANFGTSNDFKGMYFGLGILIVSNLKNSAF